MANLYDLPNPRFSQLTREEQEKLVVALRADRRRVPTSAPATRAAKTTKTTTTKKRLSSDLKGLSVQELKLLEEMLNNVDTD